MICCESLKSSHLRMFKEKRTAHRALVLELYRDFLNSYEHDEIGNSTFFAAWQQHFARKMPAEIYADERIVGTGWHRCWNTDRSIPVYPHNPGHYVPDYAQLLTKGIADLHNEIDAVTPTDIRMERNKAAFHCALDAFSAYILSYATAAEQQRPSNSEDATRLRKISATCRHIALLPPKTFEQALQLIWFAQIILVTEANDSAISFGRLDRLLQPYYAHDIAIGAITPEEALALIKCFYIKCSECDESAMVTVGGREENELSLLFLRAQTQLNVRQPSLAVLLCRESSDELYKESRLLAAVGAGMPAIFHDALLCRGLENIGLTQEEARDYAIVGCYEAAPPGAFANTTIAACDLYAVFDRFLAEYDESCDSFVQFKMAFKRFFARYYKSVCLAEFRSTLSHVEQGASPFAACMMKGTLQRGLLPEEHGCDRFLFGINFLGIGLLLDSLCTINELVFTHHLTTVSTLQKGAHENFTNPALYRLVCSKKDGYGSLSPFSCELTNEISQFIAKTAIENPIAPDVISSPALFRFVADIYEKDGYASINGRKRGELLPYGVMPGATPHAYDSLSMMLAAAKNALEYFPDGAPLMISAQPEEIADPVIFNALVKTYFEAGGFHIAISAINATVLEEAYHHPELHPDLMVKISGYSTQFAPLDDTMKRALIERNRQRE